MERASTFKHPVKDGEAGGFTVLDMKRLGRTHHQLIVDRGELSLPMEAHVYSGAVLFVLHATVTS